MIQKLNLKKYDCEDLRSHIDKKIGELEQISLKGEFVASKTRLDEIKQSLREIYNGNNSAKLYVQDLKILLYHSGELEEDLYEFFVKDYLDKNWSNDLWKALFNAIILQWNKPCFELKGTRHSFLQMLGETKIKKFNEMKI